MINVPGLLRSKGCGGRCLEDGRVGRPGGARRGCLGRPVDPGPLGSHHGQFDGGKLQLAKTVSLLRGSSFKGYIYIYTLLNSILPFSGICLKTWVSNPKPGFACADM